MPTPSEAMQIALQHHQAGQLQVAEQFYRQILALDPRHADALHLFGVIAYQTGNYNLAVEYISRAIESNAAQPDFHINLGTAFQAQGKLNQAIACFRRAIELKPERPDAHYNLGNALKEHGQPYDAIDAYRRAIDLQPDYAAAHYNLAGVLHAQANHDDAVASYRRATELNPNLTEAHYLLGTVFLAQGDLDEAAGCFRWALAQKPDHAEAHFKLGNVLQAQGNLDEATASFHRAINLQPNYVEAFSNLGNALKQQGKLDEAVIACRRALELKPDYAPAHYNLGTVLQDQGQHDEAIAAYRNAIKHKPELAEAHYNLGISLQAQRRLDEAIDSYRRAVEAKPDYAQAHAYQAYLLLLKGDFERGWPEYEWRWKLNQIVEREYAQPLWNGDPLEGRTILLHAEQGLGDTFQFIRYAPLLKQLHPAATLIVQCQRSLIKLLANTPGIDQLISEGDNLPALDVHSPLLSLPRILNTTIATIPANVPYVFADPALVTRWRQHLAQHTGFRIGINWQGRPGKGEYRKRDIPLDCFAPLARLPNVSLISLQKSAARDEPSQAAANNLPLTDLGDDFDTARGAFMDTAAVMMNVDLVITSDTAVPHLAGALAVPVWLTLPYVPDWRWLLDRTDSPWYPTMRLFRQKSPGDWTSVFDHVQTELNQLLTTR